MTSGLVFNPYAIATPIAAPTTGDFAETTSENGLSQESMEMLASWESIRPMISDENRPSAIALMSVDEVTAKGPLQPAFLLLIQF